MTYEETQAKLQHKRKVARRIKALKSQQNYVQSVYDHYDRVPFSSETDRKVILSRLANLIGHLSLAIDDYTYYLALLKR